MPDIYQIPLCVFFSKLGQSQQDSATKEVTYYTQSVVGALWACKVLQRILKLYVLNGGLH